MTFLWIAPLALAQTVIQTAPENIEPRQEQLQLSHSQSHDIALSGDMVYLDFVVKNPSDHISKNITVQISLTEDSFLEAFTQDLGDYDETKGQWQLPKLGAKESATLSFSFIMNSNQNIDFQALITSINTTSSKNQLAKINGSIKWVEDDCLVVFNDFSQSANGRKRGLYADCASNYPNNFLQVFDRWGALVFEMENYDNSWTGKRHPKLTKFDREELVEGTYFYVLSFPESERSEKSGWIYISE